MVNRQHHRGPDGSGIHLSPQGFAGLGHNRLAILDLTEAGRQPMHSVDHRYTLVFNGEIYNYLELRAELGSYPFRSNTDSEVVLAAFERWGPGCLHRLIGMFAFLLWDEREQRLLAIRDRFGVKPLYYGTTPEGALAVASEIKALWSAGVPAEPDERSWATYLACGLQDHQARTFWRGISALPAGHILAWTPEAVRIDRWYDLESRVEGFEDQRPDAEVEAEYAALLTDSVRLRFRSDVPVGVAISGGLDSSVLLGAVREAQRSLESVRALTFVSGDAAYDELPWVRRALARTGQPLTVCELRAWDVPELAASVQASQDEPFGGLPTLAYARLFEEARRLGVIVVLDGQGMDEQWAGYDYYRARSEPHRTPVVQGVGESPVRPACLVPEFRALAEPLAPTSTPVDSLRALQFRDIRQAKLPRGLRFNDRASMRASVELREPFLDHRLVELALRQPDHRKIRGATQKYSLRSIARRLIPQGIVEAPKRPVQTPQREWLRGPLRKWATAQIETTLRAAGGTWLEPKAVREAWQIFVSGQGDSSYFAWQWVSLALMGLQPTKARAPQLTPLGAVEVVG
jgi:asparagine synthase (glutamine-hydrolysing)